MKGPKGTLQRSFKHMSLDIQSANGGKEIKVDLWFGNRETIAAIRSVPMSPISSFSSEL